MKGNGGFYRYFDRQLGKTKYHIFVGTYNNRDLVDELTSVVLENKIWKNRWLFIHPGIGNYAEEFAVWILKSMFSNVDTKSYYVDKYSHEIDKELKRERISDELLYLDRIVEKYGEYGDADIDELLKVKEIIERRKQLAVELMIERTNRLLELGLGYDQVVLIINYRGH